MGKLIFKCIVGGYFAIAGVVGIFYGLFAGSDMALQPRLMSIVTFLMYIIGGAFIVVRSISNYRSGETARREEEKRAKREEKLRVQNERKRAMAATSNKVPKSPKKSKTGRGILFVGGILTYLFFGIIGGLTSKYTKKRR